MPNFADASRALLKTDLPWSWSSSHEAALQHLKELVSSAPELRFFNPAAPVVIQTDSSPTFISSCLLQEGQPVAFASSALTDAETRYVQIEKMLLAIVFACTSSLSLSTVKAQWFRVIINLWNHI